MLRIECPWCGPRDEEEFTVGRPLEVVRPANPQELSDDQWADYLFNRANARGPAFERWRHTFGCRQWFGLERHTVSHAITRVFRLDEYLDMASQSRLRQGLSDVAMGKAVV